MDIKSGFIDKQEKFVAHALLNYLIPFIRTKTDNRETQNNFAVIVAHALISGVLHRLVLKHFEDFNIFFQQAIESLPEVMLTDLSEHSADGLSKRLDRLVDIYNRSQYAGRRKSSRTGQRTPHPIKARFVYELAKAFSGKWRKKTNQQAICDDLQSAGVFQLLACNLSPSDVKEIVEMISEGTMTNNEIALELCAKNFKIAPDTLDRHYLRGTAGHVTKLNEAFKKM